MAKVAWRWVRSALTLLAVGAGALAVWAAWRSDTMVSLKENAHPVPFFAVMALLPALGMPITPLFVLAGATFGVWGGLLGSLVALALNLALCYWIAQSKLRPRIASLLRRLNYELPNFGDKDKGSFRFTLLMKMAPGLPAFAKNYALGVAGVPFWIYFVVSMLITGSYAAALVFVGESLFDHQLDHAVLAVVAVVILGGGLWWWRRRRNRPRPPTKRPTGVLITSS
jgi:uncharacterized membrane protein YdjX (TVP38/TMEM64 family)